MVKFSVVDVAQLVELRIVTPAVEGSIPFVHPNFLKKWFRVELPAFHCASVAELVDALDLGSSGATRESSSLSARTILYSGFLFFHIPINSWCHCPEVRLFDDSLGKVNRDKLCAFNFWALCGITVRLALFSIFSFTYRICNLRIFHASVS